jgi:hypothetical protein
MKRWIDKLSGVERTPGSPAYGDVVVPLINLWNAPSRTKVIGQGFHGDEVEVLDLTQGKDKRAYYLVRVQRTGDTGWLPAPFLHERGQR